MNCFQWQNQASDYLDGTLEPSLKLEADDHVDACKECSERFVHYRLIISSIATQAHVPLPAVLKKTPFAVMFPRTPTGRTARAYWKRIPWYLRTLLEGFGIVLIVVLGISTAPVIRAKIEKSRENRMKDFEETLSPAEIANEAAEAELPPLQAKNIAENGTSSASADELSGEDESDDTSDSVKVGRSELWRFTLKTVSPDELRTQVVKALTELNIPRDTPGLGGMQVPGGIEFDLVLPQNLVASIKHVLQKITPALPPRPNHADEDGFSWYKVKSKRNLPEGKSQVVIWLSQH